MVSIAEHRPGDLRNPAVDRFYLERAVCGIACPDFTLARELLLQGFDHRLLIGRQVFARRALSRFPSKPRAFKAGEWPLGIEVRPHKSQRGETVDDRIHPAL